MCTHYWKAGDLGDMPEATLFAQAQAGCTTSLDVLMARHDGLVQAVVRRYGTRHLPFAQAVQAGRLGLWHAILGYNPERRVAFSTYAWTAIMRHVWRAVKRDAHVEPGSNLACEVGLEVAAPATVWEADLVQAALHKLMTSLSPRLRYVIVARYGLDGREPATYAEIGAQLGLTGERARQLHTEALVVLRHPAHSYTLRSLLERHSLADYAYADELAKTGCGDAPEGGDAMIAEVLNPIGQCDPAALNSAPSPSVKIKTASLEAAEARARDKLFVSQCSLKGLASRLPLRWPLPPGLPASPKRKYRSQYVYQSQADLDDPLVWRHMSDFELLLHLVDFSNLRPVLAQLMGWTPSGRRTRPNPL
jgi:RNA polymerase sigma factor (sigma-70 family)